MISDDDWMNDNMSVYFDIPGPILSDPRRAVHESTRGHKRGSSTRSPRNFAGDKRSLHGAARFYKAAREG